MLSFKDFFLNENRIEFLKGKHSAPDSIPSTHDTLAKHRDAHAIIDHFATHADPSPNKQHTQWIVDKYKKGQIRQEDAGRIHQTLSAFDAHKRKLPTVPVAKMGADGNIGATIQKPGNDLNSYHSLAHLENHIAPHITSPASNKEEKRLIKSEGADLVHENEHATIHKLKTKEAACAYGAGTKWCTAAKNNNMFDAYNKDGPMYVVQSKHPDETGKHRKFQMHFESDQHMDEEDSPVDLHHLSKKYGLHGVPEFEHKHVAFMKPENLKKPEYLLKHQEAIAATGKHEHIDALLDAAK